MKKIIIFICFSLVVQNKGCFGWLDCCSGKDDVSIEGINQTGYPIINSEAQEIIIGQIIQHYEYQQQMMNYYHQEQKELKTVIMGLSADLRDQRQAIVDLLREMRDLKNRLKPGKDAQTDRRALQYKTKRSSRPLSNKTH